MKLIMIVMGCALALAGFAAAPEAHRPVNIAGTGMDLDGDLYLYSLKFTGKQKARWILRKSHDGHAGSFHLIEKSWLEPVSPDATERLVKTCRHHLRVAHYDGLVTPTRKIARGRVFGNADGNILIVASKKASEPKSITEYSCL